MLIVECSIRDLVVVSSKKYQLEWGRCLTKMPDQLNVFDITLYLSVRFSDYCGIPAGPWPFCGQCTELLRLSTRYISSTFALSRIANSALHRLHSSSITSLQSFPLACL